jgi:hypothetical protein
LKEIGVFNSLESITLDWVRNTAMRAEYYNFDSGKWEFDRRKDRIGPVADGKTSQKQKYDGTDLKIIGQLQIDANMSLKEMCEKVGERKYKTFTWHYRAHVFSRGLIKGYRLNWTGTRYGNESKGETRENDRNTWIDIIADNLAESERLNLMADLNRVPFLWIEGSGTRTYYARMVIPPGKKTEMLKILETAISHVRDRVEWFDMDPAHALSFSLQTQNYDENKRCWKFNKKEVLQSFEILQKLRHEDAYGYLPTKRRRS